MNSIERVVAQVVDFLELRQVPYMVFGALAVLVWGKPRVTQDVDFKVEAGDGLELLGACASVFRIRVVDGPRFVAETAVIPILVGETDMPVDLVLASLPYESAAIRRARDTQIGGRTVKVCSPEDLILHKIVSERPRDLEDVAGIVHRQGEALDRSYLEPRIRELATAFARPEIWEIYERARKQPR